MSGKVLNTTRNLQHQSFLFRFLFLGLRDAAGFVWSNFLSGGYTYRFWAPPPPTPSLPTHVSVIFMQFSGKYGRITYWSFPPMGLPRPHPGKSFSWYSVSVKNEYGAQKRTCRHNNLTFQPYSCRARFRQAYVITILWWLYDGVFRNMAGFM